MLLLLLSRPSLFAQTNTALRFNSFTQDHATTTNATVIPDMGSGGFTVELWAYVPLSEGGTHSFISQGSTTGFQFGIGYNGSNNHIYVGDMWPDANANVIMGQWNHIALVSSPSGDSAWLYLNGVRVDSTNAFFYINGGSQLQFGTNVDSTTFFTGAIDQVRIWDYPRTTAQIKAGMYGIVDSTSPGLVADYLFDANPGVTHSSGHTVGADLTLINATILSSPIQPGNNGVRFSATGGTKITAPGTSTLDLNVGTIEAYVNPNTVNGTIINLGSDASHTRFSVHLDNTGIPAFHTLGIRNSLSATMQTIFYPAGFTAGRWYQLAFVTNQDGSTSTDTTGVYVNGSYVGKIAAGYDITAGTKLPLTIGANGIDNTENWDGSLDEVRVWNVPLTQSQIVTNLVSTLTGNEPNLVALYSFDQGIPDGDNTGMTLAIDNSPLTNNATLSSFSLSSTNTNFTAHAMVPLPLTLLQFTATKQSNTAALQWQTGQEQNTRDFVIERSSDGKTYTDIGTVAAAGTSNTKRYYYFTDNTPLEGNNYYRLRQRDLDGQSTYSPVRMLSFTMSGNLIWYSTGANAAEVRLHNGSN